MTDKPTKCECKAANSNIPRQPYVIRCDWCKGMEEYLAIADAFCEVAAKMDSFDYHPLMIAWKELQNWDENA